MGPREQLSLRVVLKGLIACLGNLSSAARRADAVYLFRYFLKIRQGRRAAGRSTPRNVALDSVTVVAASRLGTTQAASAGAFDVAVDMGSSIFDRWWFRAFAAVALFFVCQLCYMISRVQNLDEEKITVEAEIQTLERKRDNLLMEIATKEREIVRLDRREQQLEVLVRDRLRLAGTDRQAVPMIYFVTPTGFRPTQKADLTRLSYTLSHVPNLHWIVVEDSDVTSDSIADILRRSRLPYTHLNSKTPPAMKMRPLDPSWYLPRGVTQRNTALAWLRTQLSKAKSGAVYFGDDDNTYDLRLF
ncbi:hypothetical protein KIN20_033934 [Parelaphostrongylus tenuis]|uniref:Galactosylgalactosylxylosylprotein 3-beta-glucuronosyltransferase n=1 Tax=Parelaphostrongylus tenuis TaxID=148309 RepID=A0AAD5WIN2_PARTN|nr:hypothetical protein KIN20_033934 [Parelaphostrongylus tenuis]